VDDNTANRRVLAEQLGLHGMRADGFGGAQEALEAMRRAAGEGDPYRIAILDHLMPDLNGDILGGMIREIPACRDTRLILMSSLSNAGNAQRFERAGFSAFLSKPVSQQVLTDMLKALCVADAGDRIPFLTAFSLSAKRPEQKVDVLPFQGSRILVADDNEVNRQVAQHMLELLGCSSDCAGNGVDAVDLACRQDYDLILMDCQMPEMDGYQATAIIRSCEPAGRRVPIIALTAHAMQGEREKCIAAGMDDFLSKPIRPQALRETLGRWLHAGESRAVPAGLVEPVEPEDDFSASQAMLGAAFPKIAMLYLNDSTKRLAALHQAAAEGNAAQLSAAAHTLYGSTVSLGGARLAARLKDLEKQSKSGMPADVSARLELIESDYMQLADKLRTLLQTA
jgi:CheY-like chemotaxis protein/HPt (histidine-containing phosphotransfer) domain-containing protein